jgi:hypothetical protein
MQETLKQVRCSAAARSMADGCCCAVRHVAADALPQGDTRLQTLSSWFYVSTHGHQQSEQLNSCPRLHRSISCGRCRGRATL